MRKVYDVLTGVILVVCLVCIVGIGGLYLMGKTPRVIVSGSMEPEIHTGSLAFIDTKVSYEDIEENDIVAFENENGDMVVHRAIAVTDGGIETQGDANDVSDGVTTTEDNFYGQYLFSIPNIGYLLFAIKSRRGIIICVTAIIVYALLGVIIGDDSDKDKEKQETKEATS